MRVAIVSTYPPAHCGIGTYTQHLHNSLLAQDNHCQVTILAEKTDSSEPPAPSVLPCWKRDQDWHHDVLATIENVQPDLVHIQHEEALLGQDARVPKLFHKLRTMGIHRVITLHSVYANGRGWLPGRWAPVRFQQALGRESDCIVVHQHTGCRDRLIAQGIHNVHMIPHGTNTVDLPSQAQARKHLGIPVDERVVLSLGFIHPRKGTHTLVRAFAEVFRVIPNSRLIVAGRPRLRNLLDRGYHRMLAAKMRRGVRDGWMDYRPGFHDAETMINLLAAADLLVFPYRQSYGSASGVLHTALGASRPVLCARGLKFAEAYDAWGDENPELFPLPNDVPHWTRAIIRVLSDEKLRAQMALRSGQLGQDTNWNLVAKQHTDVYQAAMATALS